jgi:hypothetical protein
MAIIRRVTRIANPRRKIRRVRRAKAVAKRRHNTARRKRSAPVIRRYSAKTLKKELRRRGVKNPSLHSRKQKPFFRRRRKNINAGFYDDEGTFHPIRASADYSPKAAGESKRRNPVLLEFGALNPHKRRKSVARKHRRSRNTRRRRAVARVHHRRRRRNPVATVHNRRRRRRNPGVRNRRHHYRRRNPMGGIIPNKQLIEMGVGVLVGVAATKYLPTLIPSQITGMIPQSSFSVPLVTAVGAAAATFLAHKFLPMGVAAGVAAGGAALTVSRLLDAFAPPSIAHQLSLQGVGDIVPTMGFSVPDRSMRQQVVQMAAAPGVGFYRRRGGR